MKLYYHRLRRSRTHRGIRDNSRKFRTRAYTKDLDQIHEDLQEGNVEKMKNQPIDADKAGLGQHYCVHCAYVYWILFDIAPSSFLTFHTLFSVVTSQAMTLYRSTKQLNFIKGE
jgi:hypothetical protein